MRDRLLRARLYVVLTPRTCLLPPEDVAARALAGGADAVQLRDKDAGDEAFVALARRLARICRDAGALFLVNDRAGLWRKCDAHGVHVGQDDAPPEEIRERFGDEPVVGLSTHSRAEAAAAAARGADYIGLGPMFPTATKRLSREPRGAALLREVEGGTPLPVFPIGGIDAGNIARLQTSRAAVGAAICGAEDPEAAARVLSSILRVRALLPPS